MIISININIINKDSKGFPNDAERSPKLSLTQLQYHKTPFNNLNCLKQANANLERSALHQAIVSFTIRKWNRSAKITAKARIRHFHLKAGLIAPRRGQRDGKEFTLGLDVLTVSSSTSASLPRLFHTFFSEGGGTSPSLTDIMRFPTESTSQFSGFLWLQYLYLS